MPAMAQDIFDKIHSYQFAKQLICEHEYALAIEALEPHLSNNHFDSILPLYLHCLYAINNNELLFTTITSLLEKQTISTVLLEQVAAICLTQDSAHLLIPKMELLDADLKIRTLLLLEKYDSCYGIIQSLGSSIDSNYYLGVLKNMQQAADINPTKYMTAAAILPGSGKLLLREYMQGFSQLFVVSAHTYLSFYAFNQYGIRSVFAWTNAVMGTAFYLGNIIGTKNLIKRKKNFKIQFYKNELKKNLYTSYFSVAC